MKKLKLAIVGLGNCASSLLQGLEYYKDTKDEKVVGLMNTNLCGYHISDIEVVAVYDVNTDKINKPVQEAVRVAPNCTTKFSDVVCDVIVTEAPVFDGLSDRMRKVVPNNADEDYHTLMDVRYTNFKELDYVKERKAKMKAHLEHSGAEVLIAYLPVGSYHAARFWAELCIECKVAFVNAFPEFICSTPKWAQRFVEAGVPCAGDDIKSQIGATIVHRVLTKLIDDRGQLIDDTYQLNVGGNTDFQNMLDEHRLQSKRTSKTEAVTSQVDYDMPTKIGPSDYISYLKDNKLCYINIRGRQFGDVPFSIELKLSVEDSPNSAGVMIDCIRMIKVAKDNGARGYQDFSTYFFKHPMQQVSDADAKEIVDMFIDANS